MGLSGRGGGAGLVMISEGKHHSSDDHSQEMLAVGLSVGIVGVCLVCVGLFWYFIARTTSTERRLKREREIERGHSLQNRFGESHSPRSPKSLLLLTA